MINITIDNERIKAEEGETILEVALKNKIYIPHICYYEGLKPSGMCRLCLVEIEDFGVKKSCILMVREKMVIETETQKVLELRREKLSEILANHPHACLVCSQREGCDRISCSFEIPKNERCCFKFEWCELRFISEYVGVKSDTPKYEFENLSMRKEKTFEFDQNLCIGCLRCLMVSSTPLKKISKRKRILVELLKDSSSLDFVRVCPTGALRGDVISLNPKVFLPQKKILELNSKNLKEIRDRSGVYTLLNEKKEIILISGTPNLKKSLESQMENPKASFFTFELCEMYTMRESELLQSFLQKHKRLPEGNDELEELF
ncbi:MAG: 2Fe-2S iron-sulfur cluster-binding protein [Candidatus Methanofastidiosia archaeon]